MGQRGAHLEMECGGVFKSLGHVASSKGEGPDGSQSASAMSVDTSATSTASTPGTHGKGGEPGQLLEDL